MELKLIQALPRAAKEEIRLMSHRRFSYGRIFEIAEQADENFVMPHMARAIELGIDREEIPSSPCLTKLINAARRIREKFYADELEENNINVEEKLAYMTEQQVIDEFNEMCIEQTIAEGEIEALIMEQEWSSLLGIPFVRNSLCNLRQMEESGNGKIADVSAFNTHDYFRQSAFPEFDKYRYFLEKTAERAKELAILHSAVSSEESKTAVKNEYVVFVNSRFRNYALTLVALYRHTENKEKKIEILAKIQKQNRQIRRLKDIWHKYAYWK